ncbi:MAG: hypothetical protein JOZ53_08305 [Planctomycetaceae bacterium]|nr:hypothetical protein [Planctomycetaceae bacterium]
MAALCREHDLLPADPAMPDRVREPPRALLRAGQYVPHVRLEDPDDLARCATVTASSRLRLGELPPDGPLLRLSHSWAMLLPVAPGLMPRVSLQARAEVATRLRVSNHPEHDTPDITRVAEARAQAGRDEREVSVAFGSVIDRPRYAFVCLRANEHASVRYSERRITGVLAATNRFNPAVASMARREPRPNIGVGAFEFSPVAQRPGGQNLAIRIDPPLDAFQPEEVRASAGTPPATCRDNHQTRNTIQLLLLYELAVRR